MLGNLRDRYPYGYRVRTANDLTLFSGKTKRKPRSTRPHITTHHDAVKGSLRIARNKPPRTN